jgi:hypothetical protein
VSHLKRARESALSLSFGALAALLLALYCLEQLFLRKNRLPLFRLSYKKSVYHILVFFVLSFDHGGPNYGSSNDFGNEP